MSNWIFIDFFKDKEGSTIIEGPDAITGLALETRVAKLIFKNYKINLATFKICSLGQYFYRVPNANPVIASGPSIIIVHASSISEIHSPIHVL